MKFRPFTSFVALVLCFCGGSSTLSAQNASAEESLSEYTFHVLYLNYRGQLDKTQIDPGINLKFETDASVFQIAAITSSLSRGFKYVGPSPLVFFEEMADAEGAIVRQPILTTDLGRPGTKLIIVAPTANNALRSTILDIDRANFKTDHVRIVNFSTQPVKAKVGEDIATLKPMALNDYSVSGDNRRFLVRLAMAGFDGKKAYVIENRRFAVKQGGRKLLILHNDASNPDKATYTSFTIPEQDVAENFSDEDVTSVNPRTGPSDSMRD